MTARVPAARLAVVGGQTSRGCGRVSGKERIQVTIITVAKGSPNRGMVRTGVQVSDRGLVLVDRVSGDFDRGNLGPADMAIVSAPDPEAPRGLIHQPQEDMLQGPHVRLVPHGAGPLDEHAHQHGELR